MSLKQAFPTGRFEAPASRQAIKLAEAKLGVGFPQALVDLYLETDGFREPLGNAQYLFPLEDDSVNQSLVSATLFWWREWPLIMPNSPDLTGIVFFGLSGADEVWGIQSQAPFNVVSYHQDMGADLVKHGGNILRQFVTDFRMYADQI